MDRGEYARRAQFRLSGRGVRAGKPVAAADLVDQGTRPRSAGGDRLSGLIVRALSDHYYEEGYDRGAENLERTFRVLPVSAEPREREFSGFRRNPQEIVTFARS